MRYRYLDDFGRGISVFAILSYGIAVLGTPMSPSDNNPFVSDAPSLQIINIIVVVVYLAILTFSHFNSE